MRNLFARKNRLYIGEKPVKAKKLTLYQYKELTSVVGVLPQLIIETILAPKDHRVAYGLVAFENSIEDWSAVVAFLTDLEYEYVLRNMTLDQLTSFIAETLKVNNFDEIVKNVKSVLGINSNQTQDAN